MSGTDTAIAELNEPTVEPELTAAPPRAAALPYLSVANARDAIAWYVDTFGASLVGESTKWTMAASDMQSCRSATACSTWPTSIPSSA